MSKLKTIIEGLRNNTVRSVHMQHDLPWQEWTAENTVQLLNALRLNTSVTELNFSNVPLSLSVILVKPFTSMLSVNKGIQSLDLSCSIAKFVPSNSHVSMGLVKALEDNHSITELDLLNNNMDEKAIIKLAAVLRNHTINSMNLLGNKTEGKALVALKEAVTVNPSIMTLKVEVPEASAGSMNALQHSINAQLVKDINTITLANNKAMVLLVSTAFTAALNKSVPEVNALLLKFLDLTVPISTDTVSVEVFPSTAVSASDSAATTSNLIGEDTT